MTRRTERAMTEKREQGIHSTNRDFERYDQVDKRQRYHLAEQAGREQFDEDYTIKVCDIAPCLHGGEQERRRFADELGTALEEIGFAVLANTGIEPALYDEATERTIELFTIVYVKQEHRRDASEDLR